jgi:hypothetical protein
LEKGFSLEIASRLRERPEGATGTWLSLRPLIFPGADDLHNDQAI